MNDKLTTRPAMTLREYYAGQALAGMMAIPATDFPDTLEHAARICVSMADALVAVLEKGKNRG